MNLIAGFQLETPPFLQKTLILGKDQQLWPIQVRYVDFKAVLGGK